MSPQNAKEWNKWGIMNVHLLNYLEFERSLEISRLSNSTFAIPNGQCFGLLGSNGAGKTTTIKMLQGELSATAGDAWIMGESVVSNRRQVQLPIGVCPQFDGLHDKLTVREHLELYARLKGVEASRIDWVVENFPQFAKLDFKADENTAGLSGGNKRKLSLALAMLGGPQVLFLDEPSSGMDPLTKRFMWNLVTTVRNRRSIILTTHSMEECEALCSRLSIMHLGKLVCLGSPQHLKSVFGTGYQIEIKTKIADTERRVLSFASENFSGFEELEAFDTKMTFRISQQGNNLANIFEKVQKVEEEYHITDYSVSQHTLEQVFLKFVKDADVHENM